jgi:hypothetical protein
MRHAYTKTYAKALPVEEDWPETIAVPNPTWKPRPFAFGAGKHPTRGILEIFNGEIQKSNEWITASIKEVDKKYWYIIGEIKPTHLHAPYRWDTENKESGK